MKILIADDSALIRTHLSELISASRADVDLHTSTDLQSTIKSLENHTFQVVVLDLQFPDGSGFSVLEFLKSRRIKPFVMVLTNLINGSIRRRSLALGADLFFDKTEEYELVVEEIVRQHNILH
ncbi:MAG: response regulator [Spirochaetota bacterium]